MSEKIEERLAYLERLADDLNEVVARQTREIDVLTRRIQWLLEREAEREAETVGTVPLGDDQPPHY